MIFVSIRAIRIPRSRNRRTLIESILMLFLRIFINTHRTNGPYPKSYRLIARRRILQIKKTVSQKERDSSVHNEQVIVIEGICFSLRGITSSSIEKDPARAQ